MKTILILGAGLSSTSLINYLLDASKEHDWKIIVGDKSVDTAIKKIHEHPNGEAVSFDVNDASLRAELIKKADLVISMLPAYMHTEVAKDCVKYSKNMLTASYISDEMKKLDAEAKKKKILLLNEMGVDPGIDHMSAMQIIDRIRSMGGKITEFESSTGGLVAPEYDNNPWNYKITWNPRNVVVAGQGASRFLQKGRKKYIPYHRLFSRIETVSILDYGEFEIYPNRDSLKYMDIYGLQGIKTLFRGTIRRPGYSAAWNVFVQLGLTDDSYTIDGSEDMTYREFLNCYLAYEKNVPVEKKLARYVNIDEDSEIMEKIRYTGIFENKKIGFKDATPAQVLQKLVEDKWQLKTDEKDMIVMHHIFRYERIETERIITASLIFKGSDNVNTAMAVTVGIPVAIAAKLILTGKIKAIGVHLPIIPEIYNPILEELKEYGIRFIEEETVIDD